MVEPPGTAPGSDMLPAKVSASSPRKPKLPGFLGPVHFPGPLFQSIANENDVSKLADLYMNDLEILHGSLLS